MTADEVCEPITETSLTVYFRHRLSDCARQLRSPPQEDTCWYIGSLLERFVRSDQFFFYDNGRYGIRPLALLYGDALEANNERERCLILQQLGDMALFLGALFPDWFTRRGIRRDYVAGMGGGAYDYLAANARHNRHIFAELANRFIHMLELVASACSRRREASAREIIALYRQWVQTGDPMAASRLRGLGVASDADVTLQ